MRPSSWRCLFAVALALAACGGPAVETPAAGPHPGSPCASGTSLALSVPDARVPLAAPDGRAARVSVEVRLTVPPGVKTGVPHLDGAWCAHPTDFLAAAEDAAAAALAAGTADDLATPAGAARALREVRARVAEAMREKGGHADVVVRSVTVD